MSSFRFSPCSVEMGAALLLRVSVSVAVIEILILNLGTCKPVYLRVQWEREGRVVGLPGPISWRRF